MGTAILADTGLWGLAVFVGVCGVVVDATVTIVIFTVADLGCWGDLCKARSPCVIETSSRTSLAGSRASVRTIGFSGAARQPVVAGFFFAVCAGARGIFIDAAVAIVVFAVAADLEGLGLDVGCTHQLSIFAACILSACAFTEFLGGLARSGGQEYVIVDLSVAVVVFAITSGFFGFVIPAVYEVIAVCAVGPSFFAFAGFFCTRADALGFVARRGCEIFVDLSVAIVIFSVASFGGVGMDIFVFVVAVVLAFFVGYIGTVAVFVLVFANGVG